MTLTFKQKIQNMFFPLGSIQRIWAGYLKGYKIRITENSDWSPLLGGWEPGMQKIMVNVIQPGQVAYDLGANSGLHGMLMARLVGDKGWVFNFEPLAENVQEIGENFAFNGISNFTTVQAAVSERTGTDYFTVTGHHKQGALVEDGAAVEDKIEVKTITIDQFIAEGNPGPAFIKMDIEGAEGAALRGFSACIDKFQPLMIIELHNPRQDAEVGQFLKAHRYSAYRFEPFKRLTFSEVKDFDKGHPHPDGIWGSIFCLPPGKKLDQYMFQK